MLLLLATMANKFHKIDCSIIDAVFSLHYRRAKNIFIVIY